MYLLYKFRLFILGSHTVIQAYTVTQWKGKHFQNSKTFQIVQLAKGEKIVNIFLKILW